jgi:hypothetical protein
MGLFVSIFFAWAMYAVCRENGSPLWVAVGLGALVFMGSAAVIESM